MNREFEKLDIKEVEERLSKFITKLKLEEKWISVSYIKDFVYKFDLPTNQINQAYLGKFIDLLHRDIADKDFEEAVIILNDVWNVFPHKDLNDKSPQDKFLEFEKDNKNTEKELTKEEKLYEEHFKKAEEGLMGYLDWAFEEVLPKYEQYIKKLKVKNKNKIVGIAGFFLEMCGKMGFFEFNRLAPDLISDFPDIFLKSVQDSKLSRKDVEEYLNSFLLFLETYYPMNSFKSSYKG